MDKIVLRTIGLTKRFGALTAVNDLSLDIEEGEVFGFLGPNGAGKTTSINMMCGLLKPDAGQVWVRGKPIFNGDDRIKAYVGVCPQNIVLWERLTCLEQLVFMAQMYGIEGKAAYKNAEKLLDDLDLAEKRNQLAKTLSGGMQRRLNVAMALVHDPQIVVLDEPEAGLDPQSRVNVREYIQTLARKKTVILTTHNMDETERLADRVAIIDHGQLLVMDSPENLKRSLGEGDLLEIRVAESVKDTQVAAAALDGLVSEVSLENSSHTLRLRALNAVGNLAAILETLHAAGVEPGEVSIRANSLEDVFIQLTGRRLRE
jgi:ABC-2 type transport system ATP-binding protein